MLKGHVFKEQVFGNQIFALFINTFLNGKNGISNNYKNGMAITYSGSTLTVDSGAVCIQGRFLEEDTSKDIVAGTDVAYCKLVIEIDLDRENTASEFVQASYKIVKNTSAYPDLTQTDIVKNNSGVYQYELARFKTGASGITDFQDMRTFLDFESIYGAIQTEYRTVLEELKAELKNVEDGSAYMLNKITEESFSQGRVSGTIKKQGRIASINFKISGGTGSTTETIELSSTFKPAVEVRQVFVQFEGSEVKTVKSHASLVVFTDADLDLTFSNSADNLQGTLTYITES